MKNIKSVFPLVACVLVIFTACGNGGNEPKIKDTSSNSTPNGPAPDNSSATNPSLGDTVRNQKDTVNSDTIR